MPTWFAVIDDFWRRKVWTLKAASGGSAGNLEPVQAKMHLEERAAYDLCNCLLSLLKLMIVHKGFLFFPVHLAEIRLLHMSGLCFSFVFVFFSPFLLSLLRSSVFDSKSCTISYISGTQISRGYNFSIYIYIFCVYKSFFICNLLPGSIVLEFPSIQRSLDWFFSSFQCIRGNVCQQFFFFFFSFFLFLLNPCHDQNCLMANGMGLSVTYWTRGASEPLSFHVCFILE